MAETMEYKKIIEALRETGISENEAKSFLAITNLGHATTGEIGREAQIHSSKSHEAIRSLVNKGLASYQIKGRTKIFYALDPEILSRKMKDREKKVRETVIALKKIGAHQTPKEGIYAYEKIEGIKTIFQNLLSETSGDSEYMILAGRMLNLKLEGFLLDFQKKRAKRGINAKIVHCLANREYGKARERIRHTQVRYVKEFIPASINIYKDYVAILAAAENPMGVLIKSKGIADSFKEHFKRIWKTAKRGGTN